MVPQPLVATVLRTAAAVTVVLESHRQLQVHQSRMPVVVQVARTRAVGHVRQRLVVPEVAETLALAVLLTMASTAQTDLAAEAVVLPFTAVAVRSADAVAQAS